MANRHQDRESLSVFIPGLMGAGIVASMLVLLGDLLRFLMPVTGARRNRRLLRNAHAAITNIVEPAGVNLIGWKPEPRVRRHLAVYVMVMVWMGVLAIAALQEAFEEYFRAGGLLYHSIWPWIFGSVVALLAALIGLTALAVVLFSDRRPVRWLVGSTWMGKLVATGELKLEVRSASHA